MPKFKKDITMKHIKMVLLEVDGPQDEIKEKIPFTVMKTIIDVLNEHEEKTVEMYQETIGGVRDSVYKLNSMIYKGIRSVSVEVLNRIF